MGRAAIARWYSQDRQSWYCFMARRNVSVRHDRGEIVMKAIVVTDQAAGTAGMKLVERPEPQAAINDVVVQVHAAGFTGDELPWPPAWTGRRGGDRAPWVPGHRRPGGA